MIHPRPQTNRENCTWHNFNVVPTYKGYYAVSGSYQSGISVIDFTNPAAPSEIAYADPAPLSTTQNITGGDWSTHFYNGKIYESDIRRGLIIWEPRSRLDAARPHAEHVEPADPGDVVRAGSRGADDLDRQADRGRRIRARLAAGVAEFSCTDNDSGVESFGTGRRDDRHEHARLPHVHGDGEGQGRHRDDEDGQVHGQRGGRETNPGGTVPATLALRPRHGADVRRVHAGRRRDVQREHDRERHLDGGRRLLSVSDPSSTNTGKLVNGAFTLANPLQASATSAGGTGAAFAAVGGSAAPTSLLTYTGPKSNDAVTLNFRQTIGRIEALRTGTYSKTLTFTLSTTAP